MENGARELPFTQELRLRALPRPLWRNKGESRSTDPPAPGSRQHGEQQRPQRRGSQLLALTVQLLCLRGAEARTLPGTGQALGHGALCGAGGRRLPQPGHGLATKHLGRTREEEARGLPSLGGQRLGSLACCLVTGQSLHCSATGTLGTVSPL